MQLRLLSANNIWRLGPEIHMVPEKPQSNVFPVPEHQNNCLGSDAGVQRRGDCAHCLTRFQLSSYGPDASFWGQIALTPCSFQSMKL